MVHLRSRRMTMTVVKPTRAKGWCNVKTGHQIIISLDVKSVTGASGGGLYATVFKVLNVDTNEMWGATTTDLVNRLSHFKYI